MALDFPGSPTNGQQYTHPTSGIIWVWDGTKWVSGTVGAAYAPVVSPVFQGNPQAPNPPAGDADTSVATTSFVAAAVAGTQGNVGRNLIHNSMFNVAQRGAGPWTVGGWTADRWMMGFSLDTGTTSISAMSDAARTAIGDEAARSYYAFTFTGNADASSFTVLAQPIEDVRRLAGKTITLSFWAISSAGQKFGCCFDQFFGGGGSPSASVQGAGQSVTLGTSWQRFSMTFAIPSVAGKTIGTAGNDSLWMNFWFSAGSASNTRSGNIGVQSGTINIWGVQLEIGSVATPLEKPDPQVDLANCQRFYQTGQVYQASYGLAGAGFQMSRAFPVPMRAAPSVVVLSQTNSNINGFAIAADQQTLWNGGTAGGTANVQLTFTYSASADL